MTTTNKIQIKIHSWDQPLTIDDNNDLKVGDVIIVETEEGMASAIVETVRPAAGAGGQSGRASTSVRFMRKAGSRDVNIIHEHRKKAEEIAKSSMLEAKRLKLPMKIVDAGMSFDGGSVTIAFTADGRVDFRELVKNLSKGVQRSVRLHQIGARDEARQSGGYGICGRELCCVKFRGNLPSISSEMAKAQQIARRGSERISGSCGRLMCCLAYEADQYREMLRKMPEIGKQIKVKNETGIVREVNALTGEIKVSMPDGSIIKINQNE